MSGPLAKARQAASIGCGICDFCAAMHVNLIDEHGEVFATANVPAATGPAFIQQFRACLQELALRCPSVPVRQ